MHATTRQCVEFDQAACRKMDPRTWQEAVFEDGSYCPQFIFLKKPFCRVHTFLESVEELSSFGSERNPPSSAPGYGMHHNVVKRAGLNKLSHCLPF